MLNIKIFLKTASLKIRIQKNGLVFKFFSIQMELNTSNTLNKEGICF